MIAWLALAPWCLLTIGFLLRLGWNLASPDSPDEDPPQDAIGFRHEQDEEEYEIDETDM